MGAVEIVLRLLFMFPLSNLHLWALLCHSPIFVSLNLIASKLKVTSVMRIDYKSIHGKEDLPLLQNKKELPSSPPLWSEWLGRFPSAPKTMIIVGACCIFFLVVGVVPTSAMAYLPSFLMSSSNGANTISICAKEMILITPRASDGAMVKCWDKDPNRDDPMAEGLTGSDGCATLTYKKVDWDGPLGGPSPDIYCTVEKLGFVSATPPGLDQHDQHTLAKLEDVILNRDRGADYGHDNGCGPHFTEQFGVNGIASWLFEIGDQCTMHDKCYWDCQIFLAKGNADDAQEFCDYEMYENMLSYCNVNNNNWHSLTGAKCVSKAQYVYAALKVAGGSVYDKSNDICPNSTSGELALSMKNDYTHPACYLDGYGCGYDGSVSDDLLKCSVCCNKPYVVDGGTVWDDHYCKCFPEGNRCGTTDFRNRHDNCNQCCSGKKRIDDGWTYDDFYCK